MGTDTKISWATLGLERAATVNPIAAYNAQGERGWMCVRVTDGCKHCYAATLNTSKRFGGNGLDYTKANADKVEYRLLQKALDDVKRKPKPTGYFWCSMTDWLLESHDWDEHVFPMFTTALVATQHRHAFLTKRLNRLVLFSEKITHRMGTTFTANFPRNIWLGVSAHDEVSAQIATDVMTKVRHWLPNAVLFMSFEPAIGMLPNLRRDVFDWVILGGESGPGARPFSIEWARDGIEKCYAAGVKPYMKQLGSNVVWSTHLQQAYKGHGKNDDMAQFPPELQVQEFPVV